jgi:hypothetical protein
MKSTLALSLSFSILGLLPPIHGAPTFTKRQDTGSNPPLHGSKDLLGYSPNNKLTEQTTEDIQYTLVPGQTEDEDLGVYLDFSNNPNPQPIRGSKGGTDPGPRTLPTAGAISNVD